MTVKTNEKTIMELTSKAPNDCAILALSFALNKSYDDTRTELVKIAIEKSIVWTFWKGTPFILTEELLKRNNFIRSDYIPRNSNRDNITGILHLNRGNNKTGHLVACINGLVFDSFSKGKLNIREYNQLFKYSIKYYWIKQL